MGPFKAYDIRGIYKTDLDEDLAYRIGRALPSLLNGKRALIGRDARLSSPSLAALAALGDGKLLALERICGQKQSLMKLRLKRP